MPVYVYSDSWKTDCIGVLEDDGHFYDRKFSYLDSSTRMSHFLGSVSSSGCVYSDPQRTKQIGVIDSYGKIYRGWNILTNIPTETAPLGCVEGDKVYRGNSTWGEYPAAYLDGDGDYRAAAAAAVLFVLCPESSSKEGGEYTPSENSYRPRQKGGSYPPGSCSEALFAILAVIGGIIGIIYLLIWIDGCSERLEDELEKNNDRKTYQEEQVQEPIEESVGWYLVNDNYGYYRANFMNENSNDTFTFTYTVGKNSTVSFKVDSDYNDLKLSSYIIYNGQQYNIRTSFDAASGEQIVVIVEQKGGTGYFNIYAYEN